LSLTNLIKGIVLQNLLLIQILFYAPLRTTIPVNVAGSVKIHAQSHRIPPELAFERRSLARMANGK